MGRRVDIMSIPLYEINDIGSFGGWVKMLSAVPTTQPRMIEMKNDELDRIWKKTAVA
jgi:hypothetical protein